MTEPTLKTEVIVVGAGVIGCAIAWRLRQAGIRVLVIERDRIGSEASYAAGGMLAPLAEAENRDDFFNLASASLAIYADFARELKATSSVDVEYRDEGTLFLALNEEDAEELERRWRWQSETGLNVKNLSAVRALDLEPLLNPRLIFALEYPGDHQVDNRRLMLALQAAARKTGVEFLTHTEAHEVLIESFGGRKRATGLMTDHGLIQAGAVVIAAGAWSSLLRPSESPCFKVEPARGQMLAIEIPSPSPGRVIYSRRAYLVPRLSGFLIAGSTNERAGYDKRLTAGGVASVLKNATELMPALAHQAILETWAGLRPRSTDDLPIIGSDPYVESLIYATGHYRNGILLAPITAQSITELIIKGESGFNLAPFSVSRFANQTDEG